MTARLSSEGIPGDEASAWKRAWDPMVAAVGQQFGRFRPRVWGERIDASVLARYIEPLELDCKLHSDSDVAHTHGYPGVVAPYSALSSLCLPLFWRPDGPELFGSEQRDAKLDLRHLTALNRCGLEPPTAYSFAVQWDSEFVRPAHIGERLCRHGALLMSCVPKVTAVGQGAFVQWESEIINEEEEVIARVRNTTYLYNAIELKESHS